MTVRYCAWFSLVLLTMVLIRGESLLRMLLMRVIRTKLVSFAK